MLGLVIVLNGRQQESNLPCLNQVSEFDEQNTCTMYNVQ